MMPTDCYGTSFGVVGCHLYVYINQEYIFLMDTIARELLISVYLSCLIAKLKTVILLIPCQISTVPQVSIYSFDGFQTLLLFKRPGMVLTKFNFFIAYLLLYSFHIMS